MSKRKLYIFLGLALLAALFVGGVVDVGGAKAATVGQPAPDFTFPDTEGNMVKLSDFRGQVVLINFWTTWCPPCKEEMPDLQRLHEEMPGRVKILAINRAEPLDPVRRFMEQYKLTFTVLLDKEDNAIRAYKILGLPESFFVDEGGVIQAKWIGPMTLKTMRELVEKTEQAAWVQ